MDYLEMLEFALIFMGGTLAIALLTREAVEWWSTREDRKSLKAIRQLEERHYREMARDAVREAEEFLKEVREER